MLSSVLLLLMMDRPLLAKSNVVATVFQRVSVRVFASASESLVF